MIEDQKSRIKSKKKNNNKQKPRGLYLDLKVLEKLLLFCPHYSGELSLN